MNWKEQSSQSHYQTAAAIADQLRAGNVDEAAAGLEELIEALGLSEKRALKNHLVRLMAHAIKWKSQPERRSRSWRATILNAREDIAEIRAEVPSLTEDVIRKMWSACFTRAKRQAEGEMNQESPVTALSWEEAFTEPYEEG